MKQFARRGLLVGLSVFLTGCAATPVGQKMVQTIYLVRHAEKVSEGRDPGLTLAGAARAAKLTDRLSEVDLTKVWSSDYQRTRSTAEPIAKAHGLELHIYNPGQLVEFADLLLAEGGEVLVVGHSNTTPDMVRLLGGDAGSPIADAWEYDRLYTVRRYAEGKVETRLERYGAPSQPAE